MPRPDFLLELRARLAGAMLEVARHATRFFDSFPPSGGFG